MDARARSGSAVAGFIAEGKLVLPGRVRRVLQVVVAVVLVAAAFEILRVELRSISWPALMAAVANLPRRRLALAITLTALNYTVLTGYDQLAFVYIGKKLPRGEIALTSFLAYAVSNNVGLAMLSGGSVRYRFYSQWGVTAAELARVVVACGVTFWLGLFALGGLTLVVTGVPPVRVLPAHQLGTLLGGILMSMPLAYVAVTIFRRKPLRLWRVALPIPSPRVAIAQIVLSCLDWALVGGVLYVLLPPTALSFLGFLGFFFVAILLGLASHIPGGAGVFEGMMVLLLRPYLSSADLLPSLLVFRGVYYLMPLAVAVIGLAADDLYKGLAGEIRG
jgi:phosphatidylglycerol lysyltransferase